MKSSILLPALILLASCSGNEQAPDKATETAPEKTTAVTEQAVPPSPAAENTAENTPSVNTSVPKKERVIRFLPPVITDEPYEDRLGFRSQEASDVSSDSYFGNDAVPEPAPYIGKQQEEPLRFVEQPAEFPGGVAALNNYLKTSLQYPPTALEAQLEGKCYIQFVVRKTGELTDFKVMKGVADCPECDKEALRVLKASPKWVPGKDKGKAVDSYFTIPVSFKLN